MTTITQCDFCNDKIEETLVDGRIIKRATLKYKGKDIYTFISISVLPLPIDSSHVDLDICTKCAREIFQIALEEK